MNSIVLTGLIVMVMHFLHTGRKRHPLPGTEERMITLDFITALFYEIDEQIGAIPKHPEAHLWPSLAFTMAAFNVLVQWHGFQSYASGFVPLSIADFSL
jgi:hypothetical protein